MCCAEDFNKANHLPSGTLPFSFLCLLDSILQAVERAVYRLLGWWTQISSSLGTLLESIRTAT